MRQWWETAKAYLLPVVVVGTTFVISFLAAVRNYPQFAPDTRYYAGMAMWFSGTDQESAARQVAAHSATFGWASPNADVLFGWGLVQPRVVYPALSAPFVKLFGISGLGVVPALAMALLVLVLLVMLGRRWGIAAALGAVLLICVSPRMMFYGTAMLTESLTALWSALLLAVAWRYQRNPSAVLVLAMVGLTVVSGFTRQATLIPAGAFIMAWLCAVVFRRRPNEWRVPALAVGATAIGVQLAQFWLFPGFSQTDQFKAKTGADTLLEAVRATPELAWHIVQVDVTVMAKADLALLVLLALALLSMLIYWRRSESHLLLGALLAYELYNVTNGTPTTFRYGMPALVFVAASVTMLLAEAAASARPPRRRHAAPPSDSESPELQESVTTKL